LLLFTLALLRAKRQNNKLKKPQAAFVLKKKKVNGKSVQMVSGRIGTRAEYRLAYLLNVIDVLDKNNMKGSLSCDG
jgi:hypothetical protein